MAVVDHGIGRHQEGDGRTAPITGRHRRRDCEVASRATAVDRDARRVDVEFVDMGGHPGEGGVTVVELRGVGMLGRLAVVG